MTLQDTSARPDAIADWVGLSPLELYTAPEGDVAALQLAAARAAFEKLAPRLPILARLAREQGVDALQFSQVGIYAPRGTPEHILNRLDTLCREALEQEPVRRMASTAASG